MKAMDLAYASIAGVAQALRARAVSPVELAEGVLARIERFAALNAFITVTADVALAQAREAEREIGRGEYRGPLHGIPVSLKDIIDTRGIRTTCGSRIRSEHVPAGDAAVTERLRTAGAVLLGKTALHEFAFGVTTDNPHYGPTRNPWRPERIPGGSSGGSGAAVSAGLGAASLGTDTGGSVRIPAALCGVVGLKPTYGRVSRHGVFPLSWTLDHVGPLTRSVEDAAIVLQAIAGPDARDASTLGHSVPDFVAGLRQPLGGLRVGVPTDEYHEEMAEDVRAQFRAALDVLASLGLRAEPVSFPRPPAARVSAFAIIRAEAASIHEEWVRDRPGDYGPDTLELLRQGLFETAAQYLRAQKVRALLLRETEELLRPYAALVLPTTPATAPAIKQKTIALPGRDVEVRDLLTRFTRLINLVGLPAITVPCGFGADGLPVGLQIVGGPMDERTILAIAHAYEQATPWHTRRPPEPDAPQGR
jgi:aspartyl-tRNA(Asn)/glutamyl-tRNA(Gln) amidotransferase subunit A